MSLDRVTDFGGRRLAFRNVVDAWSKGDFIVRQNFLQFATSVSVFPFFVFAQRAPSAWSQHPCFALEVTEKAGADT